MPVIRGTSVGVGGPPLPAQCHALPLVFRATTWLESPPWFEYTFGGAAEAAAASAMRTPAKTFAKVRMIRGVCFALSLRQEPAGILG